MTESGLGKPDLPCFQAGIWSLDTFVTNSVLMLYLVAPLTQLAASRESKREYDGKGGFSGRNSA